MTLIDGSWESVALDDSSSRHAAGRLFVDVSRKTGVAVDLATRELFSGVYTLGAVPQSVPVEQERISRYRLDCQVEKTLIQSVASTPVAR